MQKISRKEWFLLCFIGVLCLSVIFSPPVSQYAHYHDFADQRGWQSFPNVLDVLSNLPFVIVGVLGLVSMRGVTGASKGEHRQDMLWLFFSGLIVTGICSSFYHFNPDDASVFLDRLGMTIAFAAILGLSTTISVSDRAGKIMVYLILFLGPVSLWVWQQTGDLLAWSMLQGEGFS